MSHTVMVTGADGFIGSHLAEELVKSGEKVRAFCLYNSFGSLGWIDTLPPEIRNEMDIFMGDVRDPNGVRTAMRGQERVFHLAALIAIPFSYHSPDSYVDTNIKGTLNVLNAARELGTQRVMVTSTSEVYGTAQYVPIDEHHPFQGQSPYSATKIGADRLAESFYRSFDLPVSIVRPFNTYGPRQSGRAIIPTIITQLLAGQQEIKLGSLTPTRDFNYVKDTAHGFMAIADCDAAIGQEINIATGVEHSIGDLANELIAQINPSARIVCEAERLRLREHVGKVHVAVVHRVHDVVGRAVEDAPDAGDVVGARGLFKVRQPRDAAADRRRAPQRRAVLPGERVELVIVAAHEVFVRGHHVLSGAQRSRHVLIRRVQTAHDLHDGVHRGVAENVLDIIRGLGGQLAEIAPAQHPRCADIVPVGEHIVNAPADNAKTKKSDVHDVPSL